MLGLFAGLAMLCCLVDSLKMRGVGGRGWCRAIRGCGLWYCSAYWYALFSHGAW